MARDRQPAGTRTAGPAEHRRLLDDVRGMVERNSLLEAENKRLRQLLDEISSSLKVPVQVVTSTILGEGPGRRGRRRSLNVIARPRRKITDPELLEKRRQALAKARAVRAERLAAAKR
jgi:hypothetical protein